MWWLWGNPRRDAYRKYVNEHKWAVKEAGLELGIPRWRLFIHDWDKYLPDMFSAYAETFYDEGGKSQYKPTTAFWRMWKRHQWWSPHHYQHHCIILDSGVVGFEDVYGMPPMARLEMLADWKSFEILGKGKLRDWYQKTREQKLRYIHPKTIEWLDWMILE